MPKLKKRGFTIIELLVVVAIIGLLAVVIVTLLSNAKAKGRDAMRVSDIRILQQALEMYQNTYEAYPNYDGDITGNDIVSSILKTQGIMTHIPLDPINNTADGVPYRYHYKSDDVGTYLIEYYLETNSIESRSKGLNSVEP